MKFLLILLLSLTTIISKGTYILIPMDDSQSNHIKAYGIAYWILTKDIEVSWLLNYRGGSFMFTFSKDFENECAIRNVSYQLITDGQANAILSEISEPDVNMDEIKLHKAPKIAVYSPKNKLPWDDAVTLVLTYSEVPYDIIYDEEVINGDLIKYDWLHLHHEDFTGQYGKFWFGYKNTTWYKEDVRLTEATANRLGFSKVSQLKLAVTKNIKEYVAGGGFLFAMCSAPDSYDIALASEGVDICDYVFDGDPVDPNAQSKLDFSKTFAFTNFKVITSPYEYAKSDIDVTKHRMYAAGSGRSESSDFFTLFDYSAKWDPIPTMLCQNHTKIIKGFMGQTTAFNKKCVKPDVLVMGENKSQNEARYIHGTFGKGTWTFYGGHDPEDYQHYVGDPPTDLNLHPNSAGYRLILNNILFPAAKKKKQKT
ncbi:MAG: asparagine synthetase B [Bacteroidetes bacterium GWE2_29_8]|nr:MAG: asparagine synthetase B [Bacteroidetes bacterium GWE2_29_8]